MQNNHFQTLGNRVLKTVSGDRENTLGEPVIAPAFCLESVSRPQHREREPCQRRWNREPGEAKGGRVC